MRAALSGARPAAGSGLARSGRDLQTEIGVAEFAGQHAQRRRYTRGDLAGNCEAGGIEPGGLAFGGLRQH